MAQGISAAHQADSDNTSGADFCLARGLVAPMGESPSHSRVGGPLGRISTSLEAIPSQRPPPLLP
jgi:hypothetical protein